MTDNFVLLAHPAVKVMNELRAKLRADAEQLASEYKWNTEALFYGWQCRQFGSFATTCAGSTEERDRFRRAWELARERERASKQVAAE